MAAHELNNNEGLKKFVNVAGYVASIPLQSVRVPSWNRVHGLRDVSSFMTAKPNSGADASANTPYGVASLDRVLKFIRPRSHELQLVSLKSNRTIPIHFVSPP